MENSQYVVCRVLATKPEKLDFVVIQKGELDRRLDVEAASKAFNSEAEAKAIIGQLGGTIPSGLPLFLDNFENDEETVWCWKDDRTMGASQIFGSEQEALDGLANNELVFEALLC